MACSLKPPVTKMKSHLELGVQYLSSPSQTRRCFAHIRLQEGEQTGTQAIPQGKVDGHGCRLYGKHMRVLVTTLCVRCKVSEQGLGSCGEREDVLLTPVSLGPAGGRQGGRQGAR